MKTITENEYQRLKKIEEAVANLIKQKGRFNTERAYRILVEEFKKE